MQVTEIDVKESLRHASIIKLGDSYTLNLGARDIHVKEPSRRAES